MTEPVSSSESEPAAVPTPASTPTPTPAAAHIPTPLIRRKNRMRLSLVWIVPLVALLVGGALLVRTLLAVGPRIEIEFRNAESLEPGKTEVRYKEVVIGRVESVSLRDDRTRVIATVQLDRSAAPIAVQDTGFWVVRPRVALAGVSGLGTLFSGAYIGVDAGTMTQPRKQFIGLEVPPFVLRGEPGRSFVLRAPNLGSLDVGSPVLYRRTPVGRVVGFTLLPDEDELSVKVFIEGPYDRLVTPQSRFWNASGVDLTVTAGGLTLNTQSVATVVAGGVAFEQAPNTVKSAPALANAAFTLFSDRRSAMAPADGAAQSLRMVFDGSVRGLVVGAPVDFLGVEIGNVRSITLQQGAPGQRFPVMVMADIYPLRFGKLLGVPGKPNATESEGSLALLQRLADSGLRAQLRTGNLLTSQLYVALDFLLPSAKQTKTSLLADAEGVITLPTMAGTLSELQPQVASIVDKLSKIPFQDIAASVQTTLGQVNTAVAAFGGLTPEAQKALVGVQTTLTEVQRTLGSAQATMKNVDQNLFDERAPVQRQFEQTLLEVQRAAQSLRVLADYLQLHPEAVVRGKPADAAVQGLPPQAFDKTPEKQLEKSLEKRAP
jgi:paraquat-inducible protein B